MDSEKCEITINQTDDGFQVNVKGKMLKAAFLSCCAEMAKGSQNKGSDCCGPEKNEEEK